MIKEQIKNGIVFGISTFLTVFLCIIGYAAITNVWTNTSTLEVNSSSVLTSTGWNSLLGNFEYLKNNMISKTGDETVSGVKTFSSFPISPSSTPTSDYQLANKKYVDDKAGNNGWPIGNYCILRSGGSCPNGFNTFGGHIRAFQGYSSNNNGSYYSNTYVGDSFFGAHGGSGFPYGRLGDIVLIACCK